MSPRIRCRHCSYLAIDGEGLCAACLGMPEDARQTVVGLCSTWERGRKLVRRLRSLGVDLRTVTPNVVRAVWRAMEE